MTIKEFKQSLQLFVNGFSRLVSNINDRLVAIEETVVTRIQADQVDVSNKNILYYVSVPEASSTITLSGVSTSGVTELVVDTSTGNVVLIIADNQYTISDAPNAHVRIYPDGNGGHYVMTTPVNMS